MNPILASYALFRSTPDCYILISTVNGLPPITLMLDDSNTEFRILLTDALLDEYPGILNSGLFSRIAHYAEALRDSGCYTDL